MKWVKKMDLNEALDIRFEQRKQYLENPNFERLSEIFSDEYTHRQRRDNYLFLYLLRGTKYDKKQNKLPDPSTLGIEEMFLENYKRPTINWNGIRQYYQKRLESIHNYEWYDNDDSDVRIVLRILEKYKDELNKSYTTF